MARAIDADKAIEVAQIKYNDWNLAMAAADGQREINLCFKKQELFKAVKAVLECVPTLTPPNEWVSVEEKLPGVSGNYICAVKDKNGSVWTIPAEWSLEMKMWIGAFGEIKNIVTHWMSLPEPPEKEKE